MLSGLTIEKCFSYNSVVLVILIQYVLAVNLMQLILLQSPAYCSIQDSLLFILSAGNEPSVPYIMLAFCGGLVHILFLYDRHLDDQYQTRCY